jgi:hypothetical protein
MVGKAKNGRPSEQSEQSAPGKIPASPQTKPPLSGVFCIDE